MRETPMLLLQVFSVMQWYSKKEHGGILLLAYEN